MFVKVVYKGLKLSGSIRWFLFHHDTGFSVLLLVVKYATLPLKASFAW